MKASRSYKARVALLLSLCFLWGLALLQGCSDASKPVTVLNGETMGTYYQIKIVDPGPKHTAAQLRKVTETILLDINNKMSTYIDDSELMRLNRAPLNEWVDVSAELYEVLSISDRVSRITSGAFDITVAPLVNLWGFGPSGITGAPDDADVKKMLAGVGYQNLELHPDLPRARRLTDIQLDLSAVAKGYGADALAAGYHALGLEHFMVEIGGELRLAGHNQSGKPWRIGVEAPSMSRTGVVQAVDVSNVGMATSGDYRNYYEVDGARISHTIDPGTGYPITHTLASVTVIAATAAEADAYATALNVMGAEKAYELARTQGLAAYFIERRKNAFVTSYSDAFKPYLP